jgi:alkanesulfonate monooxygenase SsuD/methylene tetrahydromethanopterin reductase-like flavin-dependent oxidoreductase (luciferase family)
MTAIEGWVCPRCQLVLAPHVNEHRCDPPPMPPPMPAPAIAGGGGGGADGSGSQIVYQFGPSPSGLEARFWTWLKAGVQAQGGDMRKWRAV